MTAALPSWSGTGGGWPPVEVRRCTTAVDVAAVADVLAAALADTPLRLLLAGTHNDRKAALRRGMFVLAGWAAEHAAVYLRHDGAGAAIWLPTGPRHLTSGDPLGAGLGPNSADDALDAAMTELDAHGTDEHGLDTLTGLLLPSRIPQQAAVASLVLTIGVDVDARHHGVGRQLLAAHQAQLDGVYATGHAVAIDQGGQRLLTAAGYRPRHVDQARPGLVLQWMHRPPAAVPDGAA